MIEKRPKGVFIVGMILLMGLYVYVLHDMGTERKRHQEAANLLLYRE